MSSTLRNRVLLISAAVLFATLPAYSAAIGAAAFNAGPAEEKHASTISKLSPELRIKTVRELASLVSTHHPVPHTGKHASQLLTKKLQAGAYNAVASGDELASQLTTDLFSATSDKHLQVFFSATPQKWIPAAPLGSEEEQQREREERQANSKDNFGLQRVEVLGRNIGYLRLTRLASPAFATDKVRASMEFLRDADGLILDVRSAGGGDPELAFLLMSHLVGPDPRHVVDMERRGSKAEQVRLAGDVAHHPLQAKPIIVLTSESTFSAGEYLPYILKVLRRATLVGERTGGGAHAGRTFELNPYFSAWLSVARPVVVATGDNWESRGVEPDILVPQDVALEAAQAELLRRRASELPAGEERNTLVWAAERLQAQTDRNPLTSGGAAAFVGSYGNRKITYGDGKLIYSRQGGGTFEMVRVSADTFALVGEDALRVEFIRGPNGNVVKLVGRRANGSQFEANRS
jgi:hypothetical protein